MSKKNSLCALRESTQLALNNACCAFADTENKVQLSAATGIRPSVLANALNPHQQHRLTVEDLILITKVSGNYCIVNSLLLQLNMVAVKVEQENAPATLAKRVLENSKCSGQLAALILDNAGETRLPLSKRNALLAITHQCVNNLVLMLNDLENKTSGISPMLSLDITDKSPKEGEIKWKL